MNVSEFLKSAAARHEVVIVSRHPAAVAFIRDAMHGIEVPVLSSAVADDVRNKVVIGNLPLHLAALAKVVVAVEFDGPPPRGQEYGLQEMRDAGARLSVYTVYSGDVRATHEENAAGRQW